ncbi:putative proline-rich receptor-like protein kinase PERK2 [Iris pallida]|uniref:Proline-rich receptor-like protein kinase PERK2 n=1 Tax=Iris pallida TaxID=29817 RepID=A0AAX6HXY6_IRIPA|nr:putative proline-rich receptor-like protein kinase PERK2 [Iris pallida]
MVPDSPWEFGFSDVVFFRNLRKGSVDYFGFLKLFGNWFLVYFVLFGFSGSVL